MFTGRITPPRARLCKALSPMDGPLDLGTRLSGGTATLDGEFRELAGDRVQLVSRTLHTQVLPITFVALTQAQFTNILDWRGEFLLLRLTDGMRIFGGYLAVQHKRYLGVAGNGDYTGARAVVYDAQVDFNRVTFSEAV